MLAKKIKYKDFNNQEVTGTFYFNLTQAEIMELELEFGLSTLMERVSASSNPQDIYFAFKALIMKAYGKRSSDGYDFEKSEQISRRFIVTEAFSSLILELMEEGKAADFVNALVPKDLAAKAKEQLEVKEEGPSRIVDISESEK